MDINSTIVQQVISVLQLYVTMNPDATQEECLGVIVGLGLTAEAAQEAMGQIGAKLAELNGVNMSFDEIKSQAISAANLPKEFTNPDLS